MIWLVLVVAAVALSALMLSVLALIAARESADVLEPLDPDVQAEAEGGWRQDEGEGHTVRLTHAAALLLSVKDANQQRRFRQYAQLSYKTRFFEQDVRDITR